MANWNLPTTSSLYTGLVDGLKDRDLDLAKMFSVLPTNPVTDMIRWSSSANRFDIYNGVSWVELASTYSINVTNLNGQLASFYQNAGNLDAGILLGARFNDTSHGARGGGTTHSAVVAAGASGFITGADKTKLDNIETAATADQTGAEIKTAYQAELNAFTDALFTKLSNIETAATADQSNSEIKTAYEVNANTNALTDILLTKLNAIESNATADQSSLEIKTAYELNANTNAFIDAEKTKLGTVETNADVTTTTNVRASGALMDDEINSNLKSFVLPASTTISAFGRTLIDDAAASNARTTLGLGALSILSSVGSAQIQTDAVGASEIAAGAVGQSEIATDGVGQSEIAANSVGQSEIKTTYQEVSFNNGNTGTTNGIYFTATGGAYCMGHQVRANVAQGVNDFIAFKRRGESPSTTDIARWIFEVTTDVSGGYIGYGRLHYINSSPPYDLGFGDIPLFVFIKRNKITKDIIAVSLSVDAPWHYNGKTDITPSSYDKDGTVYKDFSQFELDLIGQGKTLKNELRGTGRAAALDNLNASPTIRIELVQAMKNIDMPDIPQPFNDITNNEEVIVLNPQSNTCIDLLTLYKQGESIAEIIHEGGVIIGNIPMIRGFDPSVQCFDVNWA